MNHHIPAQVADQDDRTWISIDDAARLLDVNEATLRGYISRQVFQKVGTGSGTRVLLKDVRDYASRRNPAKVAAGKKYGLVRKPRLPKPNGVVHEAQKTPFEIALTSREELLEIETKLTLLLTRKAELEEVIKAVETIERFANLTAEGLD